MKVQDVLARIGGVVKSGDGWTGRCPAHDDSRNSLSINVGANDKPLLYCHAGCSYETIMAAAKLPTGKSARRILAQYDYMDESGALLYQVLRYDPKGFSQRKPDGQGGFEYKLNGTRRVLYQLPKITASDLQTTVFIVEGEEDADRLNSLGEIATTNAGGAGKWRDDYSEFLRGRKVAILPDNDAPGRAHAQQVARSLQGVAASVRVVDLPDLPTKGDVSDWLNAGGTIEQLKTLVDSTPPQTFECPEQSDIREATQEKKQSQATRLIALAKDAELFHAPDGKAYATVHINGHKETLPLKSGAFRDWLSHEFYKREGTSPNSAGLQDALNTISGKARFEGPETIVHIRLAAHDDAIYLDLCDSQWRVVKITCAGWGVISSAPVKFRRTRGMLPLPEPERGGSVGQLRPFVNVRGDADWTLLCSWLVASLRPRGPYPPLALNGEQGSAKTTTARVLRSCIDPNTASLRSEPREERDLMIAANNGWCIAFDNLSRMPVWLSDGLCRLATGGGFATRELYANDEEILFNAQRPVLLNGIEELAARPDLIDRALILDLPPIPEEKRKVESTFWREFEEVRPKILGALLDAVSSAMRNESSVRLSRLPRMADFAVWATAAESAFGFEAGAFMAAYDRNRSEANDLALEASPVAAEVIKTLPEGERWTVTYTELLDQLERSFGDSPKRPEGWPKSARGLAGQLTRIAVNLRKVGIHVSAAGRKNHNGRQQVTLSRTISSENSCEPHSPRSPDAQAQEHPSDRDKRAGEHDDNGDRCSPQCSPEKASDNGVFNAGERGEHERQPHSGSDEGRVNEQVFIPGMKEGGLFEYEEGKYF